MAKSKKRNPQDVTLRNNAARRKEAQALSMRLGALEQRLKRVEEALELRQEAAARQGRRW